MPIDAPVIAQVSKELTQLLPVRIDQIYQPFTDEFLFCGYGSGESFKLVISLNSQYGRMHLIQGRKDNPIAPTPFCMLLRKHFSGSKLLRFEAVPFERISKLTFEVYDQALGLRQKNLYVELTGKSSNLIITESDGTIIDAWRKISLNKPDEREILTGNQYELPSTKGRWQPVTINLEQFKNIWSHVPRDISIDKFLLKHWYGLSPLSINEITRQSGLEPSTCCGDILESQIPQLYQSFLNWAGKVDSGEFHPTCLYEQSGIPVDCSAIEIKFPPTGIIVKEISELNPVIAEIFHHRHERSRFQEAKQNLMRKIKSLLDKSRTKLAKQESEAAAAEKGDQYRIMGELLTSYSFQIKKGSSQASLVNHYDPEGKELIIKLDPALSPQVNAQAYFKKYQKARKGQLAIAEQIAKTKEDIEYLESLETMAQNSSSIDDLKLVREELEQNEKKPRKQNKTVKKFAKKEAPAEPRQYKTPAGHTVLVGRNNLQNDRLTFKIADPGDLWFHTQKIPGSHVVLRPQPGIAIDDESLNYACQLAVYFSKARESTKVPVDYTQRKNVKKPPGSKPGFVIYDFFKTAIITPDFKIIKELGIQEST